MAIHGEQLVDELFNNTDFVAHFEPELEFYRITDKNNDSVGDIIQSFAYVKLSRQTVYEEYGLVDYGLVVVFYGYSTFRNMFWETTNARTTATIYWLKRKNSILVRESYLLNNNPFTNPTKPDLFVYLFNEYVFKDIMSFL